MYTKNFFTSGQLERNSFLWSQARLVIAAVALFMGGVPVLTVLQLPAGLTQSVLTITWLITGVSSVYLALRWHWAGHRVFGGKETKDTAALVVALVSGVNLGWTGLTGNNIGMSIASGRGIFFVVGVLYLVSAWHLNKRWKQFGRHLF